MKTKYFTLAILLMVVFVFSGCESLGLDGKTNAFGVGGSSTSTGTVDGTKGLVLTFDPEFPPTTAYKDSNIGFSFKFLNYLEHDITDLRIKASGYDPTFVEGAISEFNTREGRELGATIFASKEGKAREYNNLRFTDVIVSKIQNNYDLKTNFDYCYETSTTLLATACVPSGTQTVCIGDDKNNNNIESQNGVMKISITKYPVNIGTSTKQTIVEFAISNAGNGELRPLGDCFPEVSGLQTVEYQFKAVLGDKEGICTESGSVDQFSSADTATITCKFNIDSSSTELTTQLTAKISGYSYEQGVKKSVNVVDVNTAVN